MAKKFYESTTLMGDEICLDLSTVVYAIPFIDDTRTEVYLNNGCSVVIKEDYYDFVDLWKSNND